MAAITRRSFGAAIAAGSALAAASPRRLAAAPIERSFPKGFRWGAATAAYQIEGSPTADGKGRSIWDVFAHTPGKIADGSTGDVACDSYVRFREDRALLGGLGANAYRFSISWPRLFPDGRGRPNPKGLDHYKRVVDDLLDHGIEPYVTLYHWDLPAALEGGWQRRDTAGAFADYAGHVAHGLGDRVRNFMTMNELRSFIDLGYGSGGHAPGLKLPRGAVNQARHHALLAHGLGVQAIRAAAPAGVQVGLAENPVVPIPVIETAEHVAAAKRMMRLANAEYLTAIMEGAYPAEWLAGQAADAPHVEPGDLRVVAAPLDFVAINYYSGHYVRAAADRPEGFALVPAPVSFPKMQLSWLGISPEGMYWAMRLATDLWPVKALYVSENGAVSRDRIVDGRVDDTDRLMFLRAYLGQLQRATAEGLPVKGYFAWSLMDNFEWAEGFGARARFGLYYTDFTTQRRMPKLTAAWYREVVRGGEVL